MDRINRIVEALWAENAVWPEFAASLHSALADDQPGINSVDQTPTRWVKLPQLCCQAAGGDPLWADDLTAAWVLFYVAADLMDAVEDGDPPDPWWAESGPGVALNTASGLYFTASLALNNLFLQEPTRPAASEITRAFYRNFLKMSSGQHLDLSVREPSLEQAWEIAAAKSGTFFATGCWAGARLANQDPSLLGAYERFGYHLGLLIQILDDLEGIKLLQHTPQYLAGNELFHSLGIVYSLSVLPVEAGQRLRATLQADLDTPAGRRAAWDLIEGSGAGLYLRTQIEHQQTLALEALHAAQPLPAAAATLMTMLQQMYSSGSIPSVSGS